MQKATNRSKLAELLAISAGLSVFQPLTASAVPASPPPNTTIIFNDTTDILSITVNQDAGGPATANGSCNGNGENCIIDVLDPALASGSNLGGADLPLDILEPGSSIISDILDAGHSNSAGYIVSFQSDNDETLGLGTFTVGDSITENGNVQTGFTITWTDVFGTPIATATIQFQSDLDPTTTGVPEPMSLAVFGAGLIGLAGLRRRRKSKPDLV